MYENFVGTWETVRNREVSVLERCPHGEVRLYYHGIFEHQPPSFLQIQLNPSRILIIESMTSMNSSTVRRLAPTQRPT